MVDEDIDGPLVERSRNGDADAFAALVRKYERPVFNLAFRMLGNVEDAGDVAQTAFLRALENLARFDNRFRFFSWLYRIAMNEALDQIGRRGRQTELTDVHVADDDPMRDAARADLGARVRAAVGRLSPDHRAVLVLRHYQDMSYEEIAQTLDVSSSTVKSRLFEARERLRLRIAGGGAEA